MNIEDKQQLIKDLEPVIAGVDFSESLTQLAAL